MSEWIPTSDRDRLPDMGALVIVGNERSNAVRAGFRTYRELFRDEWCWRIDDGSAVRQSHFTHWRSLPPGPKEER